MYKLSAVTREQKGEKVRRDGLLPAVVYGAQKESISLSLSPEEFVKVFTAAGESSLIDLTVDNKSLGQVLVYEVDYDPVNDRVSHVDFKRVEADKKITATVEIIFVGEAPAVKELGGTFIHNLESVDIECLPKDLMHDIKVDVSVLKTFDDVIKVSDLPLNEGVEIVDQNPDQVVAKVAPALTEEQIKAMEEAGKSGDVSQVEGVADKEKADEKEGKDEAKKAEENKEAAKEEGKK